MDTDILKAGLDFAIVEDRVGSCYPKLGLVRALCEEIQRLCKILVPEAIQRGDVIEFTHVAGGPIPARRVLMKVEAINSHGRTLHGVNLLERTSDCIRIFAFETTKDIVLIGRPCPM